MCWSFEPQTPASERHNGQGNIPSTPQQGRSKNGDQDRDSEQARINHKESQRRYAFALRQCRQIEEDTKLWLPEHKKFIPRLAADTAWNRDAMNRYNFDLETVRLVIALQEYMPTSLAIRRVFGDEAGDTDDPRDHEQLRNVRLKQAGLFVELLKDVEGKVVRTLAEDRRIQSCFFKATECPLNAYADNFKFAVFILEQEVERFQRRSSEKVLSEEVIFEYFAPSPTGNDN